MLYFLPFGVLEIAKWFTLCLQMAAVMDVGQVWQGLIKKAACLESHQQLDGNGFTGAKQTHLFNLAF